MSWPPENDPQIRNLLYVPERDGSWPRTLKYYPELDKGGAKTLELQTYPPTQDWRPTPLGDILDEIHNPDPEPDYMQFYQPLGALLGEAEPNKLPTQDWEYDLINHQVAGNLEQPAYKNLTPEVIQLATEKGAPAKPAAKAPTASLAQADQQMQESHVQRRRAQRKGLTGPASQQTQAGDAADDAQGATPKAASPTPPRNHVQRRRDKREGLTGGQSSLGATPTPIDGEQRAQSRHGTRTPKTGQIQVPQKFQQLVQDLGIDVEANYKEAVRMASRLNVPSWVREVRTKGGWDYKNHKEVTSGGKFHGKYSGKLLDDFGNWHFGVVANGFGWNMETSLLGAGGNQVIRQGGGDPVGFKEGLTNWLGTAGGLLQYDRTTEQETYGGKSWGDNPGDAINIMEGWKDANKAY